MDRKLLRRHIDAYIADSQREPDRFQNDLAERAQLVAYYRGFTRERLLAVQPGTLYEYMAKLWAMRIWGNKQYVVDKVIEDNGLDHLQKRLADLVWAKADIAKRWDAFRSTVKGMGPAMISEILCKTHPDDFMLWNRRASVGLDYLGVPVPRYDYQLTGAVYKTLCGATRDISVALAEAGIKDVTLLSVDYFIWEQLQVQDNLSKLHAKKPTSASPPEETVSTSDFIHNDVRDKLRDVGQWLGFTAQIERKVAEGSKVDAVWESTIGNMGRVIYVFEVQTKGSIDGLMMNLLKSLNNPAVQGVIAVSDKKQLATIEKHAAGVRELRDKLRYWDYEDVLRVHESLEFVNSSINALKLVPEGF